MTKILVPENISQLRLMRLILDLTRSDNFIFLLAQKQFQQDTQQAISTQTAQISFKYKNLEGQQQQGKAKKS